MQGQRQLGHAPRHALREDDLGARGDGRARGRAPRVNLGRAQRQSFDFTAGTTKNQENKSEV